MSEEELTTQDEQAPAPERRSPAKLIITIAVAGAIVAVAFAVMSRPTPGQRTTTDTSVTVVLSAAEGSAQAQYPVTLLEGGDPLTSPTTSSSRFRASRAFPQPHSTGRAELLCSPSRSIRRTTSAQEVANALAQSGYLQTPTQ